MVSMHECLSKYINNANTWNEVMIQAYNHTFAEAKTYQGNPYPYQQVGVEVKFYQVSKFWPFKHLLYLLLPHLVAH